ncbi:hypothetical protein HQQ81_22200 [Microbacteriaceae bacterium VKM Ac-2854]|nr:hypothetical protein [Microbacteriaceae bacterium VKM Ac-2854]
MRAPRRFAAAVLLAASVVISVTVIGGPIAAAEGVGIDVAVPEAATGSPGAIVNAQLRWGLNRESSGGAFAGGCNFLSAGAAGDSGSARVWTESDGLYAANSGSVSIEKATAAGGWTAASFATKCLDPSGAAVTASSLTSSTQTQVVIDGGRGSASASGLSLSWTGSFTVAFYGGMTYWTVTDPQLTLDAAGNGSLTATASGYGASMHDTTKWDVLTPRSIVLAELRGVPLDSTGFAVLPEYLGVASQLGGQAARTSDNAAYWGSFPASFLQFQTLTGQVGYWLTSGGQRDPAKPATTLFVNYDANAPAVTAPVDAGAPSAAQTPENSAAERPAGTAASAAAAAAAAAPAAAGLTGDTTTVVRDDGSALVPELSAVDSTLLLVIGGIVLSLLVSILAVRAMMGLPLLPWRRPAHPAG